jgi:hypothetical protein
MSVERPDEAGMSRVDEAHAAAMKAQLEFRGFRVVAIVPAPPAFAPDRQPPLSPQPAAGD